MHGEVAVMLAVCCSVLSLPISLSLCVCVS
jgi:hypothetical protein